MNYIVAKTNAMRLILFSILLTIALAACQTGEKAGESDEAQSHEHPMGHDHGHDSPANEHMHKSSVPELIEKFESPERAEWQKPLAVITAMGDLDGKTVMDLGAGSGYFTFRLAEAGANVIAADINKKFLQHINTEKANHPDHADRVQIRKVMRNDPGLTAAEADIFFTCNTYHHIDNRIIYMQTVATGLKPDGMVVIVDFKKIDSPHGPPKKLRISAEQMEKEMTKAGFELFRIERDMLPEQNIYFFRLAAE